MRDTGDGEADDDALESLANHLKALGNGKRLRLLRYLSTPHYLEEMARELSTARQTAREHLQTLLDIGVVEPVRRSGASASVNEYVVVPQRLFRIHEDFARLGVPERERADDEDDHRALTQALVTRDGGLREEDLPRITIVHGLRIGQTTTLQGEGPWLIGRDPAAALSLDYDPFVSTRHAEIRRREGGGHDVVDLYSSNGTFLEWKRIARGDAREVVNGSVIRVGKTLLLFRRPK